MNNQEQANYITSIAEQLSRVEMANVLLKQVLEVLKQPDIHHYCIKDSVVDKIESIVNDGYLDIVESNLADDIYQLTADRGRCTHE